MAARIHSIFDRAILSQAAVDAFKKLHPVYMLKNPVMFVTEGSGLDPHISLKNAFLQASRVAQARGIGTEVIERIIRGNTEARDFGVFGEPSVNVLKLNLALDRKM